MKLTVLNGEPGVDVDLDPRTETDRLIKLLDTDHTLRPILKRAGYRLELFEPGRWFVHGLKSVSGEDWNVIGDHPRMVYASPPDGASYPSSPAWLIDTVDAGPPEKASQVFERLFTENRDRELDHYSITRRAKQDFTAVRCGERKAIGERSFAQTARLVATQQPDLDLDFAATLIRAASLAVATEALGHAEFPDAAWTVVPVTNEFWPRRRWHSQPMTVTDLAPIERYAREQSRTAEAAVEAEVQAFRREVAARQA